MDAVEKANSERQKRWYVYQVDLRLRYSNCNVG